MKIGRCKKVGKSKKEEPTAQSKRRSHSNLKFAICLTSREEVIRLHFSYHANLQGGGKVQKSKK